jgi:hypothetical protein
MFYKLNIQAFSIQDSMILWVLSYNLQGLCYTILASTHGEVFFFQIQLLRREGP